MSQSSCVSGLLSVPTDVLVEHILARLCYKDLVSCQRSCHHLCSTISSSVRLTYRKELALAGLVDNPKCPRHEISLNARFSLLRKREQNWTYLEWNWTKSLPFEVEDKGMVRREEDYQQAMSKDGRFFNEQLDEWSIHPRVIFPARLPSEKDMSLEWDQPINIKGRICGFGLSSENDLLVALKQTDSYSTQIHLIQYSTRLSHPLALHPVLQWKIHFDPETDVATVLVCGHHLLISFSAPSTRPGMALGVWDWTSGLKKADMRFLENQSSSSVVAFVREDLFVRARCGRDKDMALDVYWIPATGCQWDSAGEGEEERESLDYEDGATEDLDIDKTEEDYDATEDADGVSDLNRDVFDGEDSEEEESDELIEIPVIQRYFLPPLDPAFECANIDCESIPGPLGVIQSDLRLDYDHCDLPSKLSSRSEKPFTIDHEQAIMSIHSRITRKRTGDYVLDNQPHELDSRAGSAFLVIRRRALLELILGYWNPDNITLSSLGSDGNPLKVLFPEATVPWREWGEKTTRMFFYLRGQNFSQSRFVATSVTGTRFLIAGPAMDILIANFAIAKPAMSSSELVSPQPDVHQQSDDIERQPRLNHAQVQVIDRDQPSLLSAEDGPFSRDIRTTLPYISTVQMKVPWYEWSEASFGPIIADEERIARVDHIKEKKFVRIMHFG